MNLIVHDLKQGTPEWDAFRLEHDGASEAAAMLNLSRKVSRNELLAIKKSGMPKEFSRFVQERVLDKGHEVEELARPIIEKIIGATLYPATLSLGRLSASCDGRTMFGDIVVEHKQWNEEYAALVSDGVVPEEHMPQCQQVLHVSKADRLIFVVSNGTPEKMVYCWVEPDPEYQARIVAGWEQFHRDLEVFEIKEKAAPVIAEHVDQLPAVLVKVDGAVAIRDNLPELKALLRKFIDKIDLKPKDDQGFANLEAAGKELRRLEKALAESRTGMLAQVEAIGTASALMEEMQELSRKTAILAERAFESEKVSRKAAIVQAGKDQIEAFRANLAQRSLMPPVQANFAAVTKNLRTFESYQNAVDSEVARVKIELQQLHNDIAANVEAIDAEADYAFLFADRAQLALKDRELVALTVRQRIADHKEAEARREEETRERIRQEEAVNLAKQQELATVPAMAADPAEPAVAIPAGTMVHVGMDMAGGPAQTVHYVEPAEDTGERLTLGQIKDRIAPLSIDREGLSALGFEHVGREKVAYLYRASDFTAICAAIVKHINSVSSKQH